MRHVEAGSTLALGETQVENLLEGMYSYLHPSTRLKFKTCLLDFREALGGTMPCGLSQAPSCAPGAEG